MSRIAIAAGYARKARFRAQGFASSRRRAPGEKHRGEAARLADALIGIGCADERTHMDVRAGQRSMDGCLPRVPQPTGYWRDRYARRQWLWFLSPKGK